MADKVCPSNVVCSNRLRDWFLDLGFVASIKEPGKKDYEAGDKSHNYHLLNSVLLRVEWNLHIADEEKE